MIHDKMLLTVVASGHLGYMGLFCYFMPFLCASYNFHNQCKTSPEMLGKNCENNARGRSTHAGTWMWMEPVERADGKPAGWLPRPGLDSRGDWAPPPTPGFRPRGWLAARDVDPSCVPPACFLLTHIRNVHQPACDK